MAKKIQKAKAVKKTVKKTNTKAGLSAAKKTTKKEKSVKYTYLFGKKTDGNAKMRNLLGGKGANLAEMARIGLPVPPGFTITTEVCTYYYENGKKYPKCLESMVDAALATVEKQLGKKFGDTKDPLLFSVRSGARESMPGMMDTILNLGLNDKTVLGLSEKTGNPRFAWDCYRRFIQMYGDVVMGVQARTETERDPFHEVMEGVKKEANVVLDAQLDVNDLKKLVERYKALIKERTNSNFPQDVKKQLWGAIGAVFGSWMNERAILYRQKYGIPSSWGTAVNVQTMVFGNMGNTSATGVAFTRD
ncbi:MAG: PEP/pyruvate-binding domain-containing protein, partial [Opitutales bacterium]|nr:PEP/pyruvate-binding domain-containing protein [Opitutales bacterium]